MPNQTKRQRSQAIAQARAVDAAAIATITGIGLMGILAGIAALLH